jgi:hypothetical protein
VACRASPRERQRKEDDLKKYLREKGVDVPRFRKTTFSKGDMEDPFTVVDEAIERDGLGSLRLLDLDTVRERWDVPWGGWRVFFGIGGWSASFVLTAALVFPLLLIANGVDPRDFDANQQSKYLVEVQLIETVETFAVLWLLLRKFAPEMEGKEFFKMDFADDPFSVEKGWLTWGLIGYVAVFFSIGFTATAIDLGTHAVEAIASGAGGGGGESRRWAKARAPSRRRRGRRRPPPPPAPPRPPPPPRRRRRTRARARSTPCSRCLRAARVRRVGSSPCSR